jgi:hypothetical protein
VSQLEVNNTEMQNTNNATAALLAAGTGTGDANTTFVYTNPTTGSTTTMSVGYYVYMETGAPGYEIENEDQSDLETQLNDIGTQQQGMSQEQSTNISATMSKDNESWEGCTNLVSSISQSLSQIVGKW